MADPRKYRCCCLRKCGVPPAVCPDLQIGRQGITVLNGRWLRRRKNRQILNNLGLGDLCLVTGEADSNIYKSARNIPGVDTAVAGMLNILDILNHDTLSLKMQWPGLRSVFG